MSGEFKPGHKVKTNRNGTLNTGKVVSEQTGLKGSFFEVKHDDGTTKKYRAGQLEKA